jgi:drug/metabolite transporter (DMT)-like permease
MQNNYLGLSLAIISMVGLGVSNFLYKKSTSTIGPINTTFFYYLFSFCIALIIWFVFREHGMVKRKELIWPALIAVFLFLSVLSFTFAVKYIDVSVGTTIRCLAFIVTVILALVFTKEHLSLKDYIALGLAAFAIILFGID